MSRIRVLGGVGVVLVAVTAGLAWERLRDAGGGGLPGEPWDPTPVEAGSIEMLGPIPAELEETSGVAASRAHPGILWSHNDRGYPPIVYALDLGARLRAVFRLVDVEGPFDWEDASMGPCPWEGGEETTCLYLADIGDNDRVRESYAIHVVEEPDPAVAAPGAIRDLSARRLAFRFPDGAHDAEGLAVDAFGNLTIVTKGRNRRIQVFRIPGDAVRRGLRTGTAVVAEAEEDLPIRPRSVLGKMATGASLSPSGEVLVVRTYYELYFFRRDGSGRFVPRGSPCALGNLEPQGEAVDFLGVGEEVLVLTSESRLGRRGSVHRVRCQGDGDGKG